MLSEMTPQKVLANGNVVDKLAPVANGGVAETADWDGFNMTEYWEVIEYLNSTRRDSFMEEIMGEEVGKEMGKEMDAGFAVAPDSIMAH